MNRNKPALYILILIAGIAISFSVISGRFSPQSTSFILILMTFIIVLVNPDIGLIIAIVSMIFSPEVVLGQTTGRLVLVRSEDMILLVVILAWALKTSLTKDIRATFNTKLTLMFSLYITTCVFSTLFAYLFSEIDLNLSIFTILKYAEYFMLFIMARDRCKTLGLAKVFLAVFMLTALAVAVHSNIVIEQEIDAGKNFFRVAPPTKAQSGGESGTLGGYILFMMGIIGGLALYTRSAALRTTFICLEMVLFRGFLYTLSRGSYLAIIPVAVMLVCFAGRWKTQLIYIMIGASILTVLFAPQMVKDRIISSVNAKEDLSGTHLELEESPQARMNSYKYVLFEKFPESPIFGHGVARYFIDGQIFMTLCEVGLLGLILLAMILIRLFKMVKEIIRKESVRNDGFGMGISVGFLAGFVGILFHALSTNTFILIKVMEPFWFIAAIVLSLPQLLEPGEAVKKPQIHFKGFEYKR